MRAYSCLMRTLRVIVSDSEYQALQKVADARDRSVEQLIRETMAAIQREVMERGKTLRDLPLLRGHRAVTDLPSRGDLYEEMFSPEDLVSPS